MDSTPKAGTPPRAAYWVLAALSAMNLLNYIDRYILAETDFGIKDTLGGILMAAFVVSYSLFSPLMGWLGDRVTRKYLLAIGVGVWSLATFASGFAGRFGLPAFFTG
jgi:MFS family permease